MKFRTLIRRNLRFHWRSHLGVVLGAAIGSAALIGALVVGDSVRESLRKRALERFGGVLFVLDARDRTFKRDITDRILFDICQNQSINRSGTRIFDSMLRIEGIAARADGSARANEVNVMGVAPVLAFGHGWPIAFGSRASWMTNLQRGGVFCNERLARQLNISVGDEVSLRLRNPSNLSRELVISSHEATSAALRLKVQGVIASDGDAHGTSMADFSPLPNQDAPLNAYVMLDELNEALLASNHVNIIVGTYGWRRKLTAIEQRIFVLSANLERRWRIRIPWPVQDFTFTPVSADEVTRVFGKVWQLADIQYSLTTSTSSLELRSPRVFLELPIVRATLAADTNAQPILTYIVSLLQAGTNTTPYSMVTAAGALWTPSDMRDDEIMVSQWLADDLRVKPGEAVTLVYFDPESGARLLERTNSFRVRGIVPMEMPWADRTLMPDFPGIEKAESTSDWDGGFPLVHKIRQKDEDYWKKYKGTPKAFVTLAAGKKMWGNRFGELTTIRFPLPTNAPLTPARSPSNGEREKSPQPSLESKAADSSTASEKPGERPKLSPLPFRRGEGQGEGTSVESFRAALEQKILSNLKPEELGLRFEPVREQALKAVEKSQPFGQLFLGFSFFLILAALLLMAMLFQFSLEQRAPEIGTLLALGFSPKQVRKLLLSEGVALALLGGIIGALGGIGYAKAMLHGLATIWRDAVGGSALNFHITGQTLAIGLFASVVVSAMTIWLTLRKFVQRPARELLAGEIDDPRGCARKSAVNQAALPVRTISRVLTNTAAIGAAALLAGIGIVGWALAKSETANAGIFFGAGSLVLIAGLFFASAWLAKRAPLIPALSPSDGERVVESRARGNVVTLGSLALRGCARRRKRSLGTMAMLSCGSFLIVSIGVFRLDANRDAGKKSSGTGGFALIGETTMPVVHDLNAQSGRDFFALNERDLEGVNFVPFRVREGDEASCLNLNAAQRPKLWGVKPGMLAQRFAFAKGDGWKSLITTRLQTGERRVSNSESRLSGFTAPPEDNTGLKPGANEIAIPAIGDANSIQWAMHKKVGDTIDYVDGRGQPFKVRIVGAVANSILQGQLIIDEAEFVKRFPGEAGYRMFLIDAPSNSVSQLSATLSRAMQDVGLELTPAAQRLAQFNAVQNTYLGTFQVLGGLGLLLGSAGLGIVVLRNVLERRGELAVLMAVGFRKPILQKLLLIENGALLLTGLALGIVAAAVAVLPAMLSPSAELPFASLTLTLGAVLVNGALWTWMATRLAVRGNLLAALRNE